MNPTAETTHPKTRRGASVLFFAMLLAVPLSAQDNYEIQVYGAETVAPGATMFELHSNFTFEGSKTIVDGMLPTNHTLHETVEITHGINNWFEVGFYIFTAANDHYAWQWVGDSGELALAGGGELVDRDRLSARRLFARYVDMGDPADYR